MTSHGETAVLAQAPRRLDDPALYPHQFGCRAHDYADEAHCTCSRQHFLLLLAELRATEADRDEQAAELDILRAQHRAALDLCDRSEALHRKIWDEMTDYADIGHPKGDYPGVPWFERQVRAALTAGKETNGDLRR